MINDFHQQRNLSYSLEMSSQDVHRQISMVEGQKQQVQLQLRDTQKENDILRKQVEMERERYAELERLLVQETQMITQKDFKLQDLERERIDLQTDNERHKLRIQSKYTIRFLMCPQVFKITLTACRDSEEVLETATLKTLVRWIIPTPEYLNWRTKSEQLKMRLMIFEEKTRSLRYT